MNSILREKTIQLRLDSSEGTEKVFEILIQKGVDPATELIAVQELPGRLWDITFSSAEVKRRHWPTITNGTGYTASTYTSSATLVTVLHVPQELDDNVVRFVLGRYGKVINGRFLTYEKHTRVFKGIRQYLVEINHDIPSSLRLGNRNCWVRYYGQQRKCWNCQSKGHEARECRLKKCYKCQEIGHTANDCEAEVKCTTCNQFGHVARKCPISFANKIKPTSSVWISGAAVVAEDTEQGNIPVPAPRRVLHPVPPVTPCQPIPSTYVSEADSDFLKGVVNKMDIDPPSPDSVPPSTEPSDVQLMEEPVPANDSQHDLFESEDNVEALSLLSAVKGNWAEPDAPSTSNHSTVATTQTRVSTTDTATSDCPTHPVEVSESQVEIPLPVTSRDKQDSTMQPQDATVGKGSALVNNPSVAPNIVPASTHSQRNKTKRKSSSQPDPSKRQERSRSSIRFPAEDPWDTIKMTQIFIEDEPWHSCYARGCGETFTKFNALQDHVNKVHPNRKPAVYSCPLVKTCKTSNGTPQEWIVHIAANHPEFVRKNELEYFDKYFLKNIH